jgi:hypothetical protein
LYRGVGVDSIPERTLCETRSLRLVALRHSRRLRSAEFLGASYENPFRPSDIAESIRVFILDYVADELRAARAKPFQRGNGNISTPGA